MSHQTKTEILTDSEDIHSALCAVSSDLYNQNINDGETIRNLACKFSQKAKVLVVRDDDETKGFCAFYCNDFETYTAYLSIIVVVAEAQGRGYANTMFQEMLLICRNNGMKRLRLEVDNSNLRAINFYKKRGFHFEKKKDETSYFIADIL